MLPLSDSLAQQRRPPGVVPPSSSQGENFSAGKPPAQLFQSDCTGAGCHSRPQGLSKDRSQGSLAGFLREHYTNSRESAGAIAAYLASVPPDARPARPERPPRAAARTDDDTQARPDQARPETARPDTAKPDAAKPDTSKPATPARTAPRGRQQQTSAAPPAAPEPAPAAAPAPPPAVEPPAPPPEPPKPKPPEFNIFD